MTTRIRTGLRIPIELNTELILLANKNGISKNALILQILWEKVKEFKQDEPEKEVG